MMDYFWLAVLTGSFLGVSLIAQSFDACNPSTCVEQGRVQNIFLRPEDASQLPLPVICDAQSENSLLALMSCWRDQCGPDYGTNPTIVNAVTTIIDVCVGAARFKLPLALTKCRIFYPSPLARPLPPDLIEQCLSPAVRAQQMSRSFSPTIESRITNVQTTFQTGSVLTPPFRDDPYMPYDMSGSAVSLPGYRPIVGTGVSEGSWDDTMLTSNWQWPSLTNAVASPNFQLVFPQSTLPFSGVTQQLGQQNLLLCLQVSDLMDCTLARTCEPDLGQVMKSLAMVYLGCSAVVRTSAVCDIGRLRYCMRVNGGNVYDVFDATRFMPYCQHHQAILSCIDKDCPYNAAGNADVRLLEQYKLFLRKFCLDIAYQTSVVKASVNCPIFQGVTDFPVTPLSMACASALIQRQPVIPDINLCTMVEANVYCFAEVRRCIYADVNAQKTALLDMIGCNAAGILQNDIVLNTATGGSQVSMPTSPIVLLATAFLLMISLLIQKLI